MNTGTVQDLRPFVPASDFAASKRFYLDLGCELRHDGADLALLEMESVRFFLQNFGAPGLAENYVLQLTVGDLADWWRRIEALDLPSRHGVRAPLAPKVMAWGARVAFVFDPSGVLWHFTQYDGGRPR